MTSPAGRHFTFAGSYDEQHGSSDSRASQGTADIAVAGVPTAEEAQQVPPDAANATLGGSGGGSGGGALLDASSIQSLLPDLSMSTMMMVMGPNTSLSHLHNNAAAAMQQGEQQADYDQSVAGEALAPVPEAPAPSAEAAAALPGMSQSMPGLPVGNFLGPDEEVELPDGMTWIDLNPETEATGEEADAEKLVSEFAGRKFALHQAEQALYELRLFEEQAEAEDGSLVTSYVPQLIRAGTVDEEGNVVFETPPAAHYPEEATTAAPLHARTDSMGI